MESGDPMTLLKPSEMLKAMTHKYLRRYKGSKGEWEYVYAQPKTYRQAAEAEAAGGTRKAANKLVTGKKDAEAKPDAEKPKADKQSVQPAHTGTLKGVTEKEAKDLLRHFARRPKGMGREKTIQTKRDLDILLTKSTFSLMSAGRNPENEEDMKMTDAQISARHDKLVATLKEEGYIFTQCKGKYVNPEESFMVMAHDADRENMMAIGKMYHQDAIVFCTKGKAEMIKTTGADAGKATMAGTGYDVVPDATDFYTKMPLSTGENIKFCMSLSDIEKALRRVFSKLFSSRPIILSKAKTMLTLKHR